MHWSDWIHHQAAESSATTKTSNPSGETGRAPKHRRTEDGKVPPRTGETQQTRQGHGVTALERPSRVTAPQRWTYLCQRTGVRLLQHLPVNLSPSFFSSLPSTGKGHQLPGEQTHTRLQHAGNQAEQRESSAAVTREQRAVVLCFSPVRQLAAQVAEPQVVRSTQVLLQDQSG